MPAGNIGSGICPSRAIFSRWRAFKLRRADAEWAVRSDKRRIGTQCNTAQGRCSEAFASNVPTNADPPCPRPAMIDFLNDRTNVGDIDRYAGYASWGNQFIFACDLRSTSRTKVGTYASAQKEQSVVPGCRSNYGTSIIFRLAKEVSC